MKSLFLHILTLIFIFTLHSKSVNYFVQSFVGYKIFVDDSILCSEENKEEKKSEEEKESTIDTFFISQLKLSNYSISIPSNFKEKHDFYISKYNKIIYSPPEFI